MEFKNVNNIGDLRKYCNRKSTKNMSSYTKDGSPLPHLIYSHHTSPSGSINIIDLYPVRWDYLADIDLPKYMLDIELLIFSYDSLIGYVLYSTGEFYLIDSDEYKTTRTTQKILSQLTKICDYIMNRQAYCKILDKFGLYTYYYLKYKGDNKDE